MFIYVHDDVTNVHASMDNIRSAGHVCMLYIYMYVCMYVRIYVCMYVYMYVCTYICMYVRMYYVCMYVCLYIYMIFQLIDSHSLDDLCSASFLDPLLYSALEGSHSSGLIPNLKLKFKNRPSNLHLSTSCELMKTLSTLGFQLNRFVTIS